MSKTKKLTRLRRRTMFTACAYCGHATPHIAYGIPDHKAINRHVLTCEMRPEAKMGQTILTMDKLLRYGRCAIDLLFVPGPDADHRSAAAKCASDIDEFLSREPFCNWGPK